MVRGGHVGEVGVGEGDGGGVGGGGPSMLGVMCAPLCGDWSHFTVHIVYGLTHQTVSDALVTFLPATEQPYIVRF